MCLNVCEQESIDFQWVIYILSIAGEEEQQQEVNLLSSLLENYCCTPVGTARRGMFCGVGQGELLHNCYRNENVLGKEVQGLIECVEIGRAWKYLVCEKEIIGVLIPPLG